MTEFGTFVTKPGVETWRGVVKSNPGTRAQLNMQTDKTWLPHALVEAGFFKSGGEVKRNRPDLWRDVTPVDFFETDWADVDVVRWTEEDEADHIRRRGFSSDFDPNHPDD